ncbi:MAG: DUF362 domain-containing protein [Hyphomonadaceae bacterium]|nr:DUF362 domain-containing protein [Clostridia bacterium]
MFTVSLVKCDSYEAEAMQTLTQKLMMQLGGMDKYIKPGMKVLIKPNLLMKKTPDEAVTTHPALVEAVVRLVQQAGGEVTLADSPGGPYNEKILKSLYAATGLEAVAQKTGAKLNYDVTFKEVPFAEGKVTKSFPVITPVLQADFVITLAKLKTHGMTTFTGCVKNLFGVIPGTYKAEYHFRMKEMADFCGMLVDLCEYVKPGLAIMDGVMGMEGAGPSAGTPRKVGVLLASENPHALDLVATAIIGLKPDRVKTLANAVERKLCVQSVEDVTIVGEPWNSFYIDNFKIPDTFGAKFAKFIPEFMQRGLFNSVSPKPVFIDDMCVRCGDCARLCPPKAISMAGKLPKIDFDKCIKCFCCQELCPKKAIEIKRPAWLKWLLKL